MLCLCHHLPGEGVLQGHLGLGLCQIVHTRFGDNNVLLADDSFKVAPSYAVIKKSGDVSGNIVGRAGETLKIECLAYGGYPIPSIVWHLGDVPQPLSSATQDSYTDQDTGELITRSTLLLEIETKDHGKQLSCEVVNEAQSLPLWVKAMLNIGCKWWCVVDDSNNNANLTNNTGSQARERQLVLYVAATAHSVLSPSLATMAILYHNHHHHHQ